jgi:hypothetical protein
MAINDRPGRDIVSEMIIQEQIQGPTREEEIYKDFLQRELHRPQITKEEVQAELGSVDPGLSNIEIPTALEMPPSGRGYSPGLNQAWNSYREIPQKAIKDVPVYLPAGIEIKGEGQKYEEEYLKENPFPRTEFQNSWLGSVLEQLGFGSGYAGGGGIAGIQNLQTGGNPNTEDFTDVGFFGFEEQASVPSEVQQERDRDLMRRAMDREEALANVARTDPYASEALYQSDPLAPEPLLPVREQQRIGPFGLGDKAGIRFTDEETQRIYDYINFQREYDPSGRRKYPEVELDQEFHLAKLRGTKPPKKSVVTTFRGVPQDDKVNVPIIKSTFPTTGGLSELDKLTLSTLDDDALSAETLIPTDINRGIFYDYPNYKRIETERRRRQWENILKAQEAQAIARDARATSQAERDAIEAQADENYLNLIAQGPWSPASGPRYAPLSTAIGTDPTLGPTIEDIYGVSRSAPVVPQAQDRTDQIMEEAAALDEHFEGTKPIQGPSQGATPLTSDFSPWSPASGRAFTSQFPEYSEEAWRDYLIRKSDAARDEFMDNYQPPSLIPGEWVPIDEQERRRLDAEGRLIPDHQVWSGRGGGLSAIGNLLGGLNFNDILKNLLISIGGGALGIPPVATAALNLGSRLLPKYLPPSSYGDQPGRQIGWGEEEIIDPWEVMEAGGEEQRAQGGLISLANGGNPSVYQAGENIEKLLATKMGYEGDKYSGVPNQEGMINTVNQNIGDNIKSGLRSIVANAYAQGNVPAPSVPQYNQAQLLNKGLTMLPNTANAPVPQQPQPQPVSNINTAYAQSTLPQSHYMQPNQVT